MILNIYLTCISSVYPECLLQNNKLYVPTKIYANLYSLFVLEVTNLPNAMLF